MTLPDERYRAIQYTQQFLRELALGKIPRVPKDVRTRALGLLRHYPSEYDLTLLARAAPEVIAERMEPLYRMIKVHEQQQQLDDHEGSTLD